MTAIRVSYTIDPKVLSQFNEVFPSSTRSATVQSLMERALTVEFAKLTALALEAQTHPDFANARADAYLWDAAAGDGLANELQPQLSKAD